MDHEAEAKKRRKIAAICCIILLIISAIELIIGVTAYQMVHNIRAGSFWSVGGLLLGALIALVGVYNKQEGSFWMLGGIACLVLGFVLAFVGAIIDGITASAVSRIDFQKCNHTTTGLANCMATYGCQRSVSMLSSCYCCYVTTQREADCAFQSVGLSKIPSYFAGVSSCDVVNVTYTNLLWTSVFLLVFSMVLSIVTAAMVSGYKKLLSRLPPNYIQTTTPVAALVPSTSAYQPVVVTPVHNIEVKVGRPIPAPRRPPPYSPPYSPPAAV